MSDSMDVSVVAIGIDWSARASVQRELDRLARTGDTKTKGGLVALLGEAVKVLSGARASWRFGGVRNASPMPAAQAQTEFRKAAVDARQRFPHELVRNVDGLLVTEPEPPLPKPSGGDGGLVVVTLVVAARCELSDVADAHDADELARALAGIAKLTAEDFVAFEIVWSPATDADRMSEESLRRLYPELVPLATAALTRA